MIEPVGSLAYFKRHPGMAVYPRHCNTTEMAERTKKAKAAAKTAYPDDEALSFYLANHIWSQVLAKFDDYEVLPDDWQKLVGMYFKVMTEQALRLTYYTLLIITREARHCKPGSHSNFKDKVGPKFMSFLNHIAGTGSDGAVLRFFDDSPDMPLIDYVSAIERVFFNGSFSGGYGGKPWGHIAANLGRLVRGETSYEMMVDTAYTLAHNNGPMFNKGMFYNHYSGEFLRHLDVQRSGQMPQYVEQYTPHILPEMRALAEKLGVGIAAEEVKYVDWYKVEALGALHTYPALKKSQVSANGPSPYMTAQEKAKIEASKPVAPEGYSVVKKVQFGPNDADCYVALERKTA